MSRGRLRIAALSALLFAFSAFLSLAPFARDLESRVTDSYFRAAPAPPARPSAVLVLIDDESLSRIGRWPWSRTVLAQLTQKLSQAGASVIGLDVLLSEPQSPEADAALRAALDKRTVLVDKIGSYPDGPRWTETLPAFAQAAGAVGHAQAPLDEDAVCRRFPALEMTTDGRRWAFALELARHIDPQRTSAFLSTYGISDAEEKGPVSIARPILIPIAYRPDRFDTISAATILDGREPAVAINGRPVIVGFGVSDIADRVNTPVSGPLPSPGVEVHAQILDAVLSSRTLLSLAPIWSAVLLAIVSVVAVLAFSRFHGWVAVPIAAVLLAAVYGGGLLAFAQALLILPVGPMMLAVALAPLVVYSADFVAVEHGMSRQLRDLRRWLAAKDGGVEERSQLAWRLNVLHDLQTRLGALYELHATLLESTQDLIAIFAGDGRLLLSNRAFAARFADDAQPGTPLERVRAHLAPHPDAPLVEAGGHIEGEVHVDDRLYFTRIIPLPPTTLAPAGGTVLMLSDLAARVERDRARSEALGFVTHELRTPLVSIQGFAEVMMRYPDSPACSDAPQTIFRESRRLLALINSYLDVLRLDAGARPMQSVPVALDAIVNQVFEVLQPLAAASGMRLAYSPAGLVVTGDELLLTGAVLNLVSNAIKYGTPRTEIRASCHRAGTGVSLEVFNRGNAIREPDLARLHEPFYRSSDVESEKTGWGLGLAFVKRIAEKHGGCVTVRNVEDGVVFELQLPAVVATLVVKGAV